MALLHFYISESGRDITEHYSWLWPCDKRVICQLIVVLTIFKLVVLKQKPLRTDELLLKKHDMYGISNVNTK